MKLRYKLFVFRSRHKNILFIRVCALKIIKKSPQLGGLRGYNKKWARYLTKQLGVLSEPSELPCIPKEVDCPALKLPFQLMLLADTVLPDADTAAFQLPVSCGDSPKSSSILQPLTAAAPLLDTVTSN